MSLFKFVKAAGRALFGGGKEAAAAAPAPADDGVKAEALVREVRSHGLDVKELSIAVNGDSASVAGKVPTQAEREKVVLAVGNVEGIAEVDDRLEIVGAEPAAVFYTVVSGDTLSKIAKEHYGDAMKYPVIFEANKPMLSHPDKIYPGQVLRIPPIEG